MYVKTFQAPNLLELMETVRTEMGPLAVLISVRRIESPGGGALLEGAAAVDREALPPPRPPVRSTTAAVRLAAPSGGPAPSLGIRPTSPEHLSCASRVGSWLKRSTQEILGGFGSRGDRQIPGVVPSIGHRNAPSPLLVLVGPSGSGKTTMAAKVAAYLRNREELPTGLITTDVANTSGALRLRSYAERLHMPMTAARSASELRDVLQRWGSRGPLVLDTPGLAAEATETVKTLLDWLHSWIPAIETHVVLDIDGQPDRVTSNLESFRNAGCQKIILTRMDRRSAQGSDWDGTLAEVLAARMPISFLGTGTRVPEDLAIPTPGRLMTCWA